MRYAIVNAAGYTEARTDLSVVLPPGAVFVTDEQYEGVSNGSLVLVDGKIQLRIAPQPTFTEIYIRKIQELGAVLQAKFDTCCSCTIGGAATHIQCCDLTDRTNLLAIEARARAFIAAGTPESLVKIRCLMNINHYLPASDMVVLLAEVFDWAQRTMDNFHAHKDGIAALVATINNLESTQQQVDDAIAALSNYDVTLNW